MIGFPLLLIPLAIYNIIAFLMRDVSFAAPLFTLPLPSGTGLPVTLTDVLLTLGILMLLCEVIKGARPGAKYLTDHLLSLLVFGGAAAEFVLLPQFGTSTFFLLTLLALVDCPVGHRAADAARHAGGVGSCGLAAGCVESRNGRAGISVRTCGQAGPFRAGARSRSRPGGSRGAENRASRGHADGAIAGSAIPGIAAGRWFAPVAG